MANLSQDICIDDFLDSARAIGVTDSEGHFTISHAQAVQKMARYSLPYPESWILKIVQAAVVWKAEEIRISQTRIYTVIEFCPAEKKNIPTEDEVVSALMGYGGGGTLPVGKLALGLRTLVQTEDYSFLLTLNTGRTEVRPLYAGREAQTLTRRERLRLARHSSAGIKIVVIHLRDDEHLAGRLFYRLLPWWRRDRQIAFELQRNAAICSIPILLNKRKLTDLSKSPVFGPTSSWKVVNFTGLKVPGEPPFTVACQAERFSAWYLCRRGRGPQPTAPREQSHEIHWVCEGVIVQTDTFRFPTYRVKLTVFVNAEGLQTDITGLLLQDSEAKSDRWTAHLSSLQSALTRQAEQINELAPDEPDAPLIKHDLLSLSASPEPALERQSRQSAKRGFFAASDYGVLSTESDKYISEVVTSNGKSHLVIKPRNASSDR